MISAQAWRSGCVGVFIGDFCHGERLRVRNVLDIALEKRCGRG